MVDKLDPSDGRISVLIEKINELVDNIEALHSSLAKLNTALADVELRQKTFNQQGESEGS